MRVVQVTTTDASGGAHLIATGLHRGLRARGHESAMAVGRRTTDDPDIHRIPRGISGPRRVLYRTAWRVLEPFARAVPPIRPIRRALQSPHPVGFLRARRQGREFFDYPGTRTILSLAGFRPDLVHLHNLHSNYFDLRYLGELSSSVPVAMTLHDEWTYTGHCAHTLVGDRWRQGCHSCPDLEVHPAIERDATHENWLAKRAIYGGTRLYVSAPSRWILDRARDSILGAGVFGWNHIPNGVDRTIFRPGSQERARKLLGLPPEPHMLLFAGNFLNTNPFKDYGTIEGAMERLASQALDRPVLLVALGGDEPPQRIGNVELRQVPYERELERVAAFYQAADVYLHAANADTFPTTILEAMATGRPVIATAVGGIPEQVRSLAGATGAWRGVAVDAESATGILVDAHDAAGMAAAATALLADAGLRTRLGENAAGVAAKHYDIEQQLDATISWYEEVAADWRRWHDGPAAATAQAPASQETRRAD